MKTPVKSWSSVLLLAPLLMAWSSASDTLTLQPESRLWVAGTSTVRSFECKARTLTVDVQSTGAAAVTAILGGEKAVTAVAVRVPATELDCNNDKMNSHMLKAIKASEFGEIAFDLASYELTPGADGLLAVILNGELALGGTRKPIQVTASAKPVDGGALQVSGAYELLMSEYGLKAPKLMLGALKVHDRVTVHFDLLLKD